MFYRFFSESMLLPAGDLLLGTQFMKVLKQWKHIEKYDKTGIANIQDANLFSLLSHASHNIPFYVSYNKYSNLPVKDWIRYFPVLKKADIKQQLEWLKDKNFKNLVSEKSSGSSGIQGEVFMTRAEQFNAIAHQTYFWQWSGYRLGDPLLQLGITPERSTVKRLKDFFLRTTYLQAFEIDKNIAGKALSSFYKTNDAFFGGYASALYTYANLAEELSLNGVHFKAVLSWGDKLFPHYRQKIEKVFHCKVFDSYGCTEGMIIAGQCEVGCYHILTPHVYVEILDENGNEVPFGQMGYVVVTRLDAYAMPIIRYYLGDLAVMEDPSMACSCGRPFPLLRQIIGRDTDIIRTPSGKYLIVHFFTGIFEHIPEIRQFRVIQNQLEFIEIEYVPDTNSFTPEILVQIENKIHHKLGEKYSVKFKKVDHIPATASGKPQMILSTIP